MDLNYIDYLILRRDAFITGLQGSEKGQEYLDNAYRLEQKNPDRKALRQKYSEEAHNGQY